MSSLRVTLAAFATLLLVGCGGSPTAPGGAPDACATPCGSECCTVEQICNSAKSKCEKTSVCVPACSGKACGDNGCGGTCGTCPNGKTCSSDGTCPACQPACTGRTCGDDGCGGKCGNCFAGERCDNLAGKCVACTPSCTGKSCGDDGCGGSCGSCLAGESCTNAGSCLVEVDGGRGDAAIVAGGDAGTTADASSAGLDAASGFDAASAGLDAATAGADAATAGPDAGSTVPGNDKCSAPEALVFVNSIATAEADTTLAVNDYQGTCGGTGSDVVYTMVLATPQNVNITVAARSGQTPAVYVRKASCTSTAGGDELGCSSGTPTTAAALSFSATAGTYYVVVDTFYSSFGRSSLKVVLSEPTPGDTCASPLPLTFTNNVATVTGDTSTFANDGGGSCGGSGGPDLVYSFTLTSPRAITARVTRDATSTSFKPVVYLRSACSTASTAERGCDAPATAATATVSQNSLPAGTYFVWVDGSASTSGKFTLDVTQATPPTPPANDACAGAAPLTFVNDAASVTADTTTANDDTSGSCNFFGSGGPDLVYSFTLATAKKVTATVTRDSASPSFLPMLYLRSVCASTAPADELACDDTGGASSTVVKTLAAGTYFVWVDGEDANPGKFLLSLTLSTPPVVPSNDTCSSPLPLTFTNNVASVSGDTSSATSDTNSDGCAGYGFDVVYSLTLTAPQDVVATVVPRAGASLYNPVVYLRKSCSSPLASDELGCDAAPNGGGTASMKVRRVPAGTYWLWVDGYSGTQGAYDLTVTLSTPPPVPPNDTCSAPTALTFTSNTVTVTGDTSGASNDSTGSCPSDGPDVVYSFTLAADQSVVATVTADPSSPGYFPSIYLRGASCAVSSEERGCTFGRSTQSVDNGLLTPGTYYLWIDGFKASSGKFSLTVTTSPPRYPPATDTCDVAGTLAFTNLRATVTGTTKVFTDDAASTSCSSSGADAVYAVTTTSPVSLSAKVTPAAGSATYRPVIYLRKACRSSLPGNELTCGSAASAGGAASLKVNSLPVGTTFLWVDGANASQGDFTLDVTLAAPIPPPSNDLCAGAVPLTLNTAVSGTTINANDDYGSSGFSSACSSKLFPPVDGLDVVYSFTPSVGGTNTLTFTPGGTTYDGVIWVTAGASSSCGAPAACVAAVDNTFAGQVETLTFTTVANTTYYIVVDGYSGDSGTFSLVVR